MNFFAFVVLVNLYSYIVKRVLSFAVEILYYRCDLVITAQYFWGFSLRAVHKNGILTLACIRGVHRSIGNKKDLVKTHWTEL